MPEYSEMLALFGEDPWRLPLLILAISVGLGEWAKGVELVCWGRPFGRPRFYSYIFGETILALIGGLASPSLARFDNTDSIFASWTFFGVMLGLGCLVGVSLEVVAVVTNRANPKTGYTIGQELTLAKALHTVAFGPIFALLFACLPIVYQVGESWEKNAILFCSALFGLLLACDYFKRDTFRLYVLAHPHPSRIRQLAKAGISIPT